MKERGTTIMSRLETAMVPASQMDLPKVARSLKAASLKRAIRLHVFRLRSSRLLRSALSDVALQCLRCGGSGGFARRSTAPFVFANFHLSGNLQNPRKRIRLGIVTSVPVKVQGGRLALPFRRNHA